MTQSGAISPATLPRISRGSGLVKNGKVFIVERNKSKNGKIDSEDLEWEYLDGDGDFRSDEVTALRDKVDIIVTNPPFSLFREFMAWIEAGGGNCHSTYPRNFETS